MNLAQIQPDTFLTHHHSIPDHEDTEVLLSLGPNKVCYGKVPRLHGVPDTSWKKIQCCLSQLHIAPGYHIFHPIAERPQQRTLFHVPQ